MGGKDVTLEVRVAICVTVGVSLCASAREGVMVGKFNGKVGGIGVGVAGEEKVSAIARKMPPMTRMAEAMPIIIPMLN